jgi:DNA (cytosine-5)-methyltransferase 1
MKPTGHSFLPNCFKFIDLFGGIGGLRKGFEALGGRCVFTSEWDRYSQKTYRANFPDDGHQLAGDITQIAPAQTSRFLGASSQEEYSAQ